MGFEALKVCRKCRPRLVILDLVLPEMNGAEVIRQLRAEAGNMRIARAEKPGTQNRELILADLQERPHGFVHKLNALQAFREAPTDTVTAGGSYFTPFATAMLLMPHESDGRGTW